MVFSSSLERERSVIDEQWRQIYAKPHNFVQDTARDVAADAVNMAINPNYNSHRWHVQIVCALCRCVFAWNWTACISISSWPRRIRTLLALLSASWASSHGACWMSTTSTTVEHIIRWLSCRCGHWRRTLRLARCRICRRCCRCLTRLASDTEEEEQVPTDVVTSEEEGDQVAIACAVQHESSSGQARAQHEDSICPARVQQFSSSGRPLVQHESSIWHESSTSPAQVQHKSSTSPAFGTGPARVRPQVQHESSTSPAVADHESSTGPSRFP